MEKECLFCKIINGDIPSFTVYEDEFFKVILDRFPAATGHMLILTKGHYPDVFDLPENIASKLYPLAQKMAVSLKEILHAEGVNILQNNGSTAGQTIYHFHLHLIPRYDQDEIVLNQTMCTDTTLEDLEKTIKKLIKNTL